jgi:hypothetical protein
MPAAYHPDFGAVVNYKFEFMPEDDDAQVRTSVAKVIGFIREDAETPIIQRNARQALGLGGGNPITGVWQAVKPYIRFKQDADIGRDLWVNDPRKEELVEVFIRPVDQAMLIATRGQGVEDCDGFVDYAGCLLTALGVPVSLVTVSADPDDPYRYSHVYLAAYYNGQRIPMDVSHGPYPGWECPNTGRVREWPVSSPPSTALPLLGLLAVLAGLGAFALSQKGTFR